MIALEVRGIRKMIVGDNSTCSSKDIVSDDNEDDWEYV